MRRLNKAAIERMSQSTKISLPKEPAISDKEREDILKFVETEVTEVVY